MGDEIKKTEIIVYISMAACFIAGFVFIYEGARYIFMKRQNDDLPDKLYVVAGLSIFLGVADIAVGVAHKWM